MGIQGSGDLSHGCWTRSSSHPPPKRQVILLLNERRMDTSRARGVDAPTLLVVSEGFGDGIAKPAQRAQSFFSFGAFGEPFDCLFLPRQAQNKRTIVVRVELEGHDTFKFLAKGFDQRGAGLPNLRHSV